jgi:hypothetical protein
MRITVPALPQSMIYAALGFAMGLSSLGMGIAGCLGDLWPGAGVVQPRGLWEAHLLMVIVGMMGAGFSVWCFLTQGSVTLVTDARARALRWERAWPSAVRIHRYDDICEIAVETVVDRHGTPFSCLSMVTEDGVWKTAASLEQEHEARDLADRLAMEIGCLSCTTPFPLEQRPGDDGPLVMFVLFPAGLLAAVALREWWIGGRAAFDAFLRGARSMLPLTLVLAAPVLLAVLCARLSASGAPVAGVRMDPRRRVLTTLHRRLVGTRARKHRYEDIVEVVVETDQLWDAARPHTVRIVSRDGFVVSGEQADDTVFRSRDRAEALLTAERLARRIGRPWRDATA